MDEHNHLNDLGHWISDNWAWISGIAITVAVASAYVFRLFLQNLRLPHHITHAELEECEEGVLIKLDHSHRSVLLKLSDHEREEFERADQFDARHAAYQNDTQKVMAEYRQENMDAHNRIDAKIDKLTQTIIENMRNK